MVSFTISQKVRVSFITKTNVPAIIEMIAAGEATYANISRATDPTPNGISIKSSRIFDSVAIKIGKYNTVANQIRRPKM
jgi:hypothetical protein